MTRIKVCGITDAATAAAAAEAGADFLGFVFYERSPRLIKAEQAKEICRAVSGSGVARVGVFVNTPAAEINRLADFCGFDWVQLSGDEKWADCLAIEKPLIRAVRIGAGWGSPELTAYLDEGKRALGEKPVLFLLDTQVPGRYGGTGRRFDWTIASAAANRFPVMMAGGLQADNVSRLMAEVRPWGVDVSSAVETDGKKDISKIKAFVTAVRRADGLASPP